MMPTQAYPDMPLLSSDPFRRPLSWHRDGNDRVATHHGAELARYSSGEAMPQRSSPRPYLHPVRTLAGSPLTAAAPSDHVHHFGLSLALPKVNGVQFWGGRTFVHGQGSTELDNHGTQRVDATADDSAVIRQRLSWHGPDGRVMLGEERLIRAALLGDGWALRWDSMLVAETDALTLGSPATAGRAGAGYGGVFWRLAMAPTTDVLSPAGHGEKRAHGSSGRWVALVQHQFDGRTLTLVLVQPDDVRPWFVRATGYDGACPAVAWDAELHLAPESRLALTLVGASFDRALSMDEAADVAQAVGGR